MAEWVVASASTSNTVSAGMGMVIEAIMVSFVMPIQTAVGQGNHRAPGRYDNRAGGPRTCSDQRGKRPCRLVRIALAATESGRVAERDPRPRVTNCQWAVG